MIAYKYDEETKEYLCQVNMQIDPLMSRKEKKNIYLLPAFSTTEKPDIKSGFKTIWNGEKWVYEKEPEKEEDRKKSVEKTEYEKKSEVLIFRNHLINLIFWRVERYQTQLEASLETTDSKETYTDILLYLQYLRDYPDDKKAEWWDKMPLDFDEWRKK